MAHHTHGYGVDPAALRAHAAATHDALRPARGLSVEGDAATAALRALVEFGAQLSEFVESCAIAYERVDASGVWDGGAVAEPAGAVVPRSGDPDVPGRDPVAGLRAAADAHEAAVAALTGWTGRASDGYRSVAGLLTRELRETAGLLEAGDEAGLRDKARAFREVAAVLAEQSVRPEILPTPAS